MAKAAGSHQFDLVSIVVKQLLRICISVFVSSSLPFLFWVCFKHSGPRACPFGGLREGPPQWLGSHAMAAEKADAEEH